MLSKLQYYLLPKFPQNLTLYSNMSFQSFLNGHIAEPVLPLVHTTKCKVFEDYIIPSSSLVPRHCDCFKENLVYFFYGRPAYRVSCDKTVPLHPEFRPVCILMKPDLPIPVQRMFPFDSGACYAGLYDSYFSQATIDNYDLGSDFVLAQAVVGAFFENNLNYVLGSIRNGLAIPSGENEVTTYYDLIRNYISSKKVVSISDDRRYSIEVQTTEEVGLVKKKATKGSLTGKVLAVAGPVSLIQDRKLRRIITKVWDADFIPYYPASLHTEEVVHGSLWQGVIEFFSQQGYLN